jgi:hypothetical protein
MSSSRRLVTSGSPLEPEIGFSRAGHARELGHPLEEVMALAHLALAAAAAGDLGDATQRGQRAAAWFQGSGPGSVPAAVRLSRGRKWFQPVACMGAWLGGRPRWTRRRWVPAGVGVRVNSTWWRRGAVRCCRPRPR